MKVLFYPNCGFFRLDNFLKFWYIAGEILCKGGEIVMMKETNEKLEYLMKKIEQHEQTIAQLLFIVAETNRKVSQTISHANNTPK